MPSPWEEPFLDAVAREDQSAVVALLAPLRTDHAGTPPLAIKNRAVRLLLRRDFARPDGLLTAVEWLTATPDDGARVIGLLLIGRFFADSPARVGPIVARLADDPNWEMREMAAAVAADAIAAAGSTALPWLAALTTHPAPNLRRAAAVGGGWAARRIDRDLARRLLDLLAPLMRDEDRYVGRNLGAFAIGDGFMRAHPEVTIAWLLGMAHSDHPRARWNVATALSAAAAVDHLPAFADVLTRLVGDPDPPVRRATVAATRKLLRRVPETALPLIDKWRCDPARADVAERLLPHPTPGSKVP